MNKVLLAVLFAVSISALLGTFPLINAEISDGTVDSFQKISDTQGNFLHVLDDHDWFGKSVASIGDLDSDGIVDFAIGAHGDDDGCPNDNKNCDTGAVYILFMNNDGTVKSEQKISAEAGGFTGNLDEMDLFGYSLGGKIGDFDGDGISDLISTAFFDDDGGTDRGALYILFLNSDGTVKEYQKISDTEGEFTGALDDGDRFAHSVSQIGDLDGDGIMDLAVGAEDDDDGGTDRGAIWILFLNSDGTVKEHQKISDTEGGFEGILEDGNRFGHGVHPIGDLDVDGVVDLVVGSEFDRGAIWILFLNSDGTVKEHQKISDTEGGFEGILDDADSFGHRIVRLDDHNGDGVVDLFVGAWKDDDGGTNRGAAWILFLNQIIQPEDTPLTEQKITASDAAAGDRFGISVVVSGDTAVVGALYGNGLTGSAYVFTRSGNTWSEQQKLTASDAAADDQFGISVAISGDTVLVGASHDNSVRGAAYIFTRSGDTWSEQQKLTVSDAAADDHFGFSVAVSGDTLVVGANQKDGFTGSAYVFTRSGTTWSEQQKLTASDAAAGNNFGFSVAVSGDTAVVGANGEDDPSNSGSAYVYIRSGTTWSEQQKLMASDAAAGDQFGRPVAVSGDTVVVGANGNDSVPSNSGSAYVFTRSGTTWSEQQKLTASDAAAQDQFGFSVAVSGDTAVIGALFDDDPSNSGSAYVFTRSGTTWSEQQKLTASDAAAQDLFGISVAVSSDTVVVGANGNDDPSDSGSAYVFGISNADLSISKSDLIDPTPASGPVHYNILVNNAGPSDAQNVVVTDTLPAGVTFIDSSAGCTESGGIVTCALGSFAASSSRQVSIIGQVDFGIVGTITNQVTVTSDTDDPNGNNNVATADTTVKEPVIWRSHTTGVGGDFLPIESTALLLAGTQTTASWLIPVVVAAIGFAIVVLRKI